MQKRSNWFTYLLFVETTNLETPFEEVYKQGESTGSKKVPATGKIDPQSWVPV